MRALVQEAMEAGAIGVSTGLFYEPAVAAPTEEVIETCRPLKDFDGLYCTHMRDEGDHVMESLEETFRIGREVGVPVVISHHKVVGPDEPRPLGGDARLHQQEHGAAADLPGLLSVHRRLHHPVGRPRGQLRRA